MVVLFIHEKSKKSTRLSETYPTIIKRGIYTGVIFCTCDRSLTIPCTFPILLAIPSDMTVICTITEVRSVLCRITLRNKRRLELIPMVTIRAPGVLTPDTLARPGHKTLAAADETSIIQNGTGQKSRLLRTVPGSGGGVYAAHT